MKSGSRRRTRIGERHRPDERVLSGCGHSGLGVPTRASAVHDSRSPSLADPLLCSGQDAKRFASSLAPMTAHPAHLCKAWDMQARSERMPRFQLLTSPAAHRGSFAVLSVSGTASHRGPPNLRSGSHSQMSSSHRRGGRHTAGRETNLTKAPGLSRAPFLESLARPQTGPLDQALAPFRSLNERKSSYSSLLHALSSTLTAQPCACPFLPLQAEGDAAGRCFYLHSLCSCVTSSHSPLTAPNWLCTARSDWPSGSTSEMGAHALLTRPLRLADNCNPRAQSCQASLLCNPKWVGWPHRATNMA